jgi:Ca2+-binding RTX toxin-like protein
MSDRTGRPAGAQQRASNLAPTQEEEIAMAKVHGTNGNDWLDALDGVTNGADGVYGYDGADWLFGLGGDDWLAGGKGADHLFGGTGSDWASYQDSSAGVHVDLFGGFGLNGDAAGDTLDSIENVFGSAHGDTLVGNAQGNMLKGAGGEDSLLGFSGNDRLYGGAGEDQLFGLNDNDMLYGDAGDDTLEGGLGRDEMYGGADADTFVWNATAETATNGFIADRIMDFDAGEGDQIDLSGIDANVYAAGNQAFTFIGTAAFSGAPGEVRYYHAGGITYLQLQTGMEVDIEGLIVMAGIHTPEASWFVL